MLGPGEWTELIRVKSALLLSVVISILLAVVLLPSAGLLMRLFTQDHEVIQAGVEYLYRVLPFYMMLGAIFILNGALRGAGEAFVPMVGSLISMWLARVPAAYILARYFGGSNLYFSYPIGWFMGLIIVIVYYLKGPWKRKAIERLEAKGTT